MRRAPDSLERTLASEMRGQEWERGIERAALPQQCRGPRPPKFGPLRSSGFEPATATLGSAVRRQLLRRSRLAPQERGGSGGLVDGSFASEAAGRHVPFRSGSRPLGRWPIPGKRRRSCFLPGDRLTAHLCRRFPDCPGTTAGAANRTDPSPSMTWAPATAGAELGSRAHGDQARGTGKREGMHKQQPGGADTGARKEAVAEMQAGRL